jgi:hypothetical protein
VVSCITLYPVLVLAGAAWIYFYGDNYAIRFAHFVLRNNLSTIYYLLFFLAREENNRWMLARKRGIQGSSIRARLFVDLTGNAAFVFGYVWIIAYAYDRGCPPAVGLHVFSSLVTFVTSIIVGYIVFAIRRIFPLQLIGVDSRHAGDCAVFWIVGTIGLWPLAFALMRQVSWFGFV